MDDRIPGTRVPDNRVHRASLWIEDLKGRIETPREWAGEPVDLELLLRECGVNDLTGPEVVEAIDFYGNNFVDVFPQLRKVTIIHPQLGPIPLSSLIRSVWADGFAHGGATVAGLRGLSNTERE